MAERFFPATLVSVSSFRADAKRFIEAGGKGLEWVIKMVEETGTFDLQPEVLKEGSRLGLTPEVMSSVIKVAEFIYDHSRHIKIGAEVLTAEVEELASGLGIKLEESTRKALTTLIAPKKKYDERRAIEAASTGGPARLAQISLSVDVRAVSERESGQLLGFVPDIVGRMTVRLGLGDERHFDFSLTRDKLNELKDAIEKATNELETISKELKGRLLS